MANGKKKSKKKLYIFGGIGLLLIILIVIAFASSGKEEIISVTTEKVEKRTITQTVAATGKIDAEFKVVITSEVTGEIISLPVKDGDKVKKGQLLIRIKGDQYQAQKERLEANLKSAKATLQIRKAELDRVTLEFNRTKELHSKGLASDAELENAQTNFLSTKASYEVAEANILQSEAQLREVMETLYKTTIYSPLDGTVTDLNVELGERVLGSNFTQGTPIMTVSDLTNMEAVVDVDENDVVLVSVGDTAIVKVDAFSDREFKGTVSEISNSANTTGLGTQEEVVNFEVKIKLIDLHDRLRPGMSCNTDIQTETVANVLAIPLQSVTVRSDFVVPQNEGETNEGEETTTEKKKTDNKPQEVVFLVDNNKAKIKNIETGISDDNYIEVKSGLEGGETVVSGSYRAISRELKDGSRVMVENRKMGTPQKEN